MAFYGFLLGLGIGLCLWLGSMRLFDRRLAAIIAPFTNHAYGSAFTPLGRLSRLTQQYQRNLHSSAAAVAHWQTLLDKAPVGYLQVNEYDQLHWLNQRACDLLNISDRDLTGGFEQEHSQRLLLGIIRSFELDQLINAVRRRQQSQQLDWTLHTVSGQDPDLPQEKPLRAYGLPLPERHVGIYIEDRQEAKTLSAERDRWTADVAHELKTPLTAIRLMAEALAQQVDVQHRSRLERLLQEVLRLGDLVQDLLELSQITFNQSRSLQWQTVDLPQLIQKAWLSLEPLAECRNLSLYYQGPDHLTLEADAHRLFRVLLNLLDNAIQYSPLEQAIIVQVSLSPPSPSCESALQPSSTVAQVYLDVIDSGPGFAAEALPKLFQRFYRADPSRARRSAQPESPRQVAPIWAAVTEGMPAPPSLHLPSSSGSGLGLAIAQQIVLAHGGVIRASNHPQTGGAWLQVQLPVTPEPIP